MGVANQEAGEERLGPMEGSTLQNLIAIRAALASTGKMDLQSTQDVEVVLGWGGRSGPL